MVGVELVAVSEQEPNAPAPDRPHQADAAAEGGGEGVEAASWNPEPTHDVDVPVRVREDVWASARVLAAQRGQAVEEVVRDALAREKWIAKQLGAGNRLLLQRRGGRLFQIIPK